MSSGDAGRTPAWMIVTVFARVALASAFLSAVADRFGWWGAAGTGKVSWGSFDSYTDYVHVLAPYLPEMLLGATAWGATVAEAVLGFTLLFGVALRFSAWASAAMLLAFALSMFFFSGFEAPLSASVFSACAAAALLALAPQPSFALSVDRLIERARGNGRMPPG